MSERNCHWGALNVHGLTRKILSQFRGIAEVVKEFMEYIADSPLLVHNAKFDMRIGISIVPSAARYQSRLGETGRGGAVLGFTRPSRQSGLILSPFQPTLSV